MKETVYANERNTLCERAFLSENSAGRLKPLRPCPVRTDFMRDRDRIIHSKSFRRLMHKMQVFLAPEGDHYRTRLTHTLEVTQIARTLARALRLNEDLTEAAALGHDLGRSATRANARWTASARTDSAITSKACAWPISWKISTSPSRCATGCSTIPVQTARRRWRGSLSNTPTASRTLTTTSTTMVNAVIAYGTDGDIGMTEPHWEATMKLRSFMFENVYFNSAAKSEDSKVADMIEHIYEYFRKQPDKLPPEYQANIEEDGVERSICDYIACMTDRYALALFEELFVPKTWQHK